MERGPEVAVKQEQAKQDVPEVVDVEVQNHGSLMVFNLNTADAQEWVEEHVGGETTWWGENGLVVEPRYAQDLAAGMVGDGLVVR